MNIIRKTFYNKYLNFIIRNVLKPFKSFLPTKFYTPVEGIIKVKVGDNKKFYFKTNRTNFVGKILFWGGIQNYEYPTIKVLMKIINPMKIFLDVGANTGYYSLVVSTINNKIKTYAFEPGDGAFNFLTDNIKINKFENQIFPQKAALADKNGESTFFIETSNKDSDIAQLSGGSSLIEIDDDKFEYREERVKVYTLDTFAKENNLANIDLIKLDTEATEHLVLRGGEFVLKNHRPIIICEVIKNNIEEEIQFEMNKYNYKYFLTIESGLKKVESLYSDIEYAYYFFIPEEKENLINEFII
jgi:FkbM family methyltransferase